MGPTNNRREGYGRDTAPLRASAPKPALPVFPPPDDLVDASALADMQAFNDLRAKRKKQKKKKIIIALISVVVLLAVAGGVFAWYASEQAAKALEDLAPQTALVEQGTFVETVSAAGNLQPVASVSVTPEVDGIVGEVLVAEGSAVEAGQTLFTVINNDLDKAVAQASQGIQEAENGVAQAQLAVDEAYRTKSAGQKAADQAVYQAQQQAAAATEAGGELPASVGEAPTFDAAAADSAIRQAELSLGNANLALQNAQAAYDEAVARAEKRTVTASISGSVVAVNIEPGMALGSASGASTAPVQIADLSQMTVSINVNEIDILKITADQTAEVTFTASPDLTLPATVVSIATTSAGAGDPSMDMYGGPGGAVTYAVKLLIAEPDPRLKPGMTAKATITTTTIEDALMVPISAVQTGANGGTVVQVLVDPETNEVAERSVDVVVSDGLTSVVTGQVKPGDQVVIGGMAPTGDGGMVDDGMAGAGDVVVG